MWFAHGGVWTSKESLHWKLTQGEKSLAAPGYRTCVSSVPVRCSTNRVTSLPIQYIKHIMNISPPFFFFVGNFCLYTRGIIEIFAHLKKNNIGFFLNPIVASSFELCMIITSFGVYVHIFHAQFDNLDLVTRSQVCQKCKLEIACIRFLSSVVYMLFGCYIHLKDHAQYDLWDSGVHSGELLSRWPRGQATYIGHKNLVPPQNATI